MEVAAEPVPYVAAGGGEGGGTSAVPEAVPMDGERWVGTGVVGPRSHEFATGLATWYLERAEAAMPLLPEGREGTVTRQGGGQTEYDEMVQPGVVGMEVGRSTDGAAGAGTTTAGSTDATAMSAGMVVSMGP